MKRQAEVMEQASQLRAQVIEVLALLAAVIAFITTGVHVATVQPFIDAARLMVLSGGVLLVVFAAFANLFRSNRFTWRDITVFIIGIAMMVASTFIRPSS